MPFFSRRKKHKHQSSSSISTLNSSAHLSTLSLHPNPSSYSSPPDPVLYRRFSEAPTFDNNTNTTTNTASNANASRFNASNTSSSYFTGDSRTANRSVQNNIQNPVLPQPASLESVVQPGESPLAEPPPVNISPHDSKLSKSKTVLTRPVSTDRPGILRRSFSKSKRSGPPGPVAGTTSGTSPSTGTGTGTGTGTAGPGTTSAGADSAGLSTSASASASASPKLQSMPEEEPPRASLSSNRSKDSSSHSNNSSRHQHRPQDSQSHLEMTDRTQTPAGRQSPYPAESRNTSQSTLEQQQQQGGRSTPAPGQKEDDMRGLAQKHDELLTKYSKVKRYYFEKEAQVQHLQNTVAHQRMAVSRTVLDDNEYASRFGRLDGAIKDLAFSIRNDWKSLPRWLLGYVNDDAHTVGSKEMTAIGRAFMSRWLVEEIFQRHFHPALDPTFSQQLKTIENNLRHQHLHITSVNSTNPNSNASGATGSNGGSSSTKTNNNNNNSNNSTASNSSSQPAVAEDKENAIAKISNWRRTTFDGLGDETLLQSPSAEENRRNLTEDLVNRLVSALRGYLNEPPPVGMENSARMIVENAVGIAEKIPLESRDVLVEYPFPGSLLADQRMRVEAGTSIPALTNVRAEHRHDEDSEDADSEDYSREKDLSTPPSPTNQGGSGPDPRRKASTSVFSTLMGRRAPPPAQSHQQPPQHSHSQGQQGKEEDKGPARIRFATFLHAEVQGKGPVNVLARAPVYLLE